MAPSPKFDSTVLFEIVIGFRIYPIGVAVDLSSAYRNIGPDRASVLVRLLVCFHDPVNLSDSRPIVIEQPVTANDRVWDAYGMVVYFVMQWCNKGHQGK